MVAEMIAESGLYHVLYRAAREMAEFSKYIRELVHQAVNDFENDIFQSIQHKHSQYIKKEIRSNVIYPFRLMNSRSGYKPWRYRRR